MDINENLIYELADSIKDSGRLAYFNSTRTELITRCPYCGDSTKNSNHGHMYIGVTAPYSFFCQRCETKGFINLKNIKDFEVDNPELAVRINREAYKAIRNTTKMFSGENALLGNRKLKLPDYNENSKIFKRKLDYLEKRFNCDLSLEDLKSLKIIMNYDDFIEYNHLKNMDKFYSSNDYNEALRNWLRVYSIGFLSTDTNYVNFRHTKLPQNERRYYTESNNRPIDVGSRIYTIENDIDLFTPELNLILTEGVMDISSVWINLYDKLKSSDTIFGAVNGRAYNLFIQTMRQMGFFKINLDIYSDKDISLNNYKYKLDFSNFTHIRVHYNQFEGEKDFGVPLERIKKKTFKLK